MPAKPAPGKSTTTKPTTAKPGTTKLSTTQPKLTAPTNGQPQKTEVAGRVRPGTTPRIIPQPARVTPPQASPAATPPVKTPAPSGERFKVNPNFRIDTVAPHDVTGSVLTMAFDERGDLLVSRENAGVMRLVDSDRDGQLDSPEEIAAGFKNVQGILPLDGKLFLVGQGPEGVGVYVLTEPDAEGLYQKSERLIAVPGSPNEHGPHGLVLGPDGCIYVMIGNHTKLDTPTVATSPYRHYYEGDVVQPRHEDPNGHSNGVKAPGGFVLRLDRHGKQPEIFAGGIRNAYDLAFTAAGELLTHDSDMEWDIGAPWYRPTRLLHITSGGEFGWRSGWAKWPAHYFDSLPAVLDTGAGSPAGMVVYDHVALPASMHGALFSCDWAKGRIVLFRMKPDGASYSAEGEIFVEGDPLNATDVVVGPDGGLYFATGGRATEGGVYRVTWKGRVPAEVFAAGTELQQALQQPQLESAWARSKVAALKEQLGDAWPTGLVAAAKEITRPVPERARALDLLQLFGPPPETALLVELTRDTQPAVRAKAAYLLGLHRDATTAAALHSLVQDGDGRVRRVALESMVRCGASKQVKGFTAAIASHDRHLAFAARRTLEAMPRETWQPLVLAAKDVRVFLQGSAALMAVGPDHDTSVVVVERTLKLMEGFLSDRDFADLLRVQQLAIERGSLTPQETVALRRALAAEYPSASPVLNRELIRTLTRLQETSISGRAMSQLTSDLPPAEKVFLAMHLPRLGAAWTSGEKLKILEFYEQARGADGGQSLGRYLERATLEFGKCLTESEQQLVLERAEQMPTAALAVLARLPKELSPTMIERIIKLDRATEGNSRDAVTRMRIAIVAILARTGDDQAMAHFRGAFDREPERRAALAMGLAQSPEDENWPVLVRALPILEGGAAQEVLSRLAEVDRRPTEPEAFRQVILRGLKLKDAGAGKAVALLEHWTNEKLGEPTDPPAAALARWQTWFSDKYPNQPEPKLPVDSDGNKWALDKLQEFLGSPSGQGDPQRGAAMYAKAQCAKCHRYGDRGDSLGPDLTTVAKRFQKREILEAILFPSHVVSDQYASKTVATTDGRTYLGLVATDSAGNVTITLPTAERMTLNKNEIEAIAPSSKSSMPEGLLNDLTAEQIADLFAYLATPPQLRTTTIPAPKRR